VEVAGSRPDIEFFVAPDKGGEAVACIASKRPSAELNRRVAQARARPRDALQVFGSVRRSLSNSVALL
jgi:hypothetical protein